MCFFILYNVEKERGESNGDEEGGPTAYYCYVKALSMKYMMPYTRSERVWIN